MTISLNFRESAYAAETGNVPIVLMTFDHADLATPIRISSDPTQRVTVTDEEVIYGTVFNGNNYIFVPARIKLPDDTEDGPGEMTIEVDNIGRELTASIRSIFSPIEATIDIVMDNALAGGVPDLTWPEYVLTNIKYDATTVTGTLTLETLIREPFPSLIFSPSVAAGLF